MLTPAQLTTLKADIQADAALMAFWQEGSPGLIADAYNIAASPGFIVWRSSVNQDEIMLNGFDWARVDNLSVGKARIWEWMFNNEGRAFNPSKPNIRSGIDSTWVGTSADLAVRAAVYTHCKRSATRIEKLLASGAGSDASPATMGFEGELPFADVIAAMGT